MTNAANLGRSNIVEMKKLSPNLAVLPWGATEGHNQHLPHGTDYVVAFSVAVASAKLANDLGAHVTVLPAQPFGNNAQQLDQIATIHISTETAKSILRDVALSLKAQGITRFVIANFHGGNEFKPLARDLQNELGVLFVVADIHKMIPEFVNDLPDSGGDHAGRLESSVMLHLAPDNVDMSLAQDGARALPALTGTERDGVWTPRPWTASHPSLGAGDPDGANAQEGERWFDAVTKEFGDTLLKISNAENIELGPKKD